MRFVRIIARLDIKGPNLVKGVQLEGLRVLGKPESFARFYYQSGADELFYMDAVASLYGRNSLLEIVRLTSSEIAIPLCVGGGIRSVDDVRAVLRAGADKVAINTAAIERPRLIQEVARAFGSSTVVVSIEAIHHGGGRYEAYTNYGRDSSGVDAFDWARQAVDLGAGEIMITSIDREGKGRGFDLELTRRISDAVPVPVVAGGGAGTVGHIAEVVENGGADAVSIASIIHYNYIKHPEYHPGAGYAAEGEGNVSFLREDRAFSLVEDVTIGEIKDNLAALGIPCRPGDGFVPVVRGLASGLQ